MPEPNSASCNGQLNSGSLHKQTRRNSFSRDVRSPVEDHDMVPSLSHNIKSQTHSRVSECDGRPSIQVKPSTVDRMVTASAGVQTDLSKVVHSSCRSTCQSPEPQTSTVRISCPRPKGLGHRCSEHKLDGSHCLCLPSDGSPLQGDPKNQTIPLPDHRNSPGWLGMPWFWDLVQLSTEIPLQLPVLLKQSHNYVFHSNPPHLNQCLTFYKTDLDIHGEVVEDEEDFVLHSFRWNQHLLVQLLLSRYQSVNTGGCGE